LDFILKPYNCQSNQPYNSFEILNENVVFSDPMLILRNKRQFAYLFKLVSLLFHSKLEERSIKITHYNKCMVISFDIDWYFFG